MSFVKLASARLASLAVIALCCAPAFADTDPALEYNRLTRPSDTIGTLGPNLFGDSVDLYSGGTSFDVTDISVPGNSNLPVALGRHLDANEADQYGGLPSFANWEIDVPYLTGYFSEAGWTGTVGGQLDGTVPTNNRCSLDNGGAGPTPPAVGFATATLYGQDYWSGNSMHVPGTGTQEMLTVGNIAPNVSPRPTDGSTYYWVTKSNWAFSCLSTLQSGGAGEGFLAVSPDGTKYYFDKMLSRTVTNTDAWMAYTVDGQTFHKTIHRYKYWIVASHVVDRFGNVVTWTYDASNHLTSITANDGRSITLAWNADGTIHTASDGTHTWTYGYSPNSPDPSDNQNLTVLTSVSLPDNSAWGYSYAGNLVQVDTTRWTDDFQQPQVTCNGDPIPNGRGAGAGYYTLTAVHPSGATGAFTFHSLIRGVSYNPWHCPGANPIHPKESENFAISTKTIGGPGLTPMTWNYTYSGTYLNNYDSSWSDSVCNPSPCTETVWTNVANPDGSEVKSTFGNRFGVTEGQLQRVTVYSDAGHGTVLDDATTTYWGYASGQPFPRYIGNPPQFRANIFLSTEQHPQLSHTEIRDGVSFTSAVNAGVNGSGYSAYANPLSTTRSSSYLGVTKASRTDIATFDDNTNLWVLQQPRTLTNSDTGMQVYSKTFDPATALLQTVIYQGLFEEGYTFHSVDDAQHQKGLLNTVTDGNGHVTTLGSYYRGLPRSLTFPDGTTKTAGVDDFGHLTSVTVPIGSSPVDITTTSTTLFGYDALGRLAQVTEPTGDSTAWKITNISFAPVASTEFGLPAGHWKQTECTGTNPCTAAGAKKVTYFDAFWQPVLTQEYDAANPTGTTRITTKAFDYAGRTTFASYPLASVTNWNDPVYGVHSAYDGLGRLTSSVQDSELGPLTTAYTYQTGFITAVTNPRGYTTSTAYQVFDKPDTGSPTTILSPEGMNTSINRDVFGKPLAITRSGIWNGSQISETRNFVYDTHQRLCKQVEPESGATLMDYDSARNIVWTVTGSNLTTLGTPAQCEADRNSVPAASKTVRTYDPRDRVLTVDVPNSTNDLTYNYFNDGALETLTNGTGATANTWSYTYNKRRLPLTETLVIDGRSSTITHAYDVYGHENSLTYPNGLVIQTLPNALGQPSKAQTYATGITYFPNGGMSGFTYGNGVVHSLTQNTRELPLRSLDQKPNTAAILDDNYTYDANANVQGIADGTTGGGNTRSMTYDGLDRLLTTNAPNQWWISASTSYDALDNIRTNQVGNTATFLNTYGYDPATWRLTSLTGHTNWTLGYDAFGNVTSKGNGADSYTFDAANRMTAVTGKESYQYDGYGRRIKVTRTSDGLIDYPVYTMGGQLLTEDDQRTNKTTNYISLNGSLVAKRTATIGGTTWTTTYEHTDTLHSPTYETNGTGVLTRTERYTPYGEPSDGSYQQGPGFTGHVTDAATGLTYAQQRYYDPVMGRFLSTDPVLPNAKGGGFNRYWYGNNNPYKFTDVDGRLACQPNTIKMPSFTVGCESTNPFVPNTSFADDSLTPKELRTKYGAGTSGKGHHWVPFKSTEGLDLSADAREVFGQSVSGNSLPNALHNKGHGAYNEAVKKELVSWAKRENIDLAEMSAPQARKFVDHIRAGGTNVVEIDRLVGNVSKYEQLVARWGKLFTKFTYFVGIEQASEQTMSIESQPCKMDPQNRCER